MPYRDAFPTEEELADKDARMDLAEWLARYDVGLLLNRARRQTGKTQGELAKQAGVTQAYISKIESGEANPTVGRLAALLGVLWFRLRLDYVPLVFEGVRANPSSFSAYQRTPVPDSYESGTARVGYTTAGVS